MRASIWSVGLLVLLCAACASNPSVSATETAPGPASTPADLPTALPSGVPPATVALVPSAPDDRDAGALAGGSATVTLGGETYQLRTGDNPICMLTIGVQVGMASDDRTVSLTVHALGELNPTNFALITTDDRWVPADGSATFEVSGGRAAWSGTLVGQHTDSEEDGVIEIVCGLR